jgi:hypothetical protein
MIYYTASTSRVVNLAKSRISRIPLTKLYSKIAAGDRHLCPIQPVRQQAFSTASTDYELQRIHATYRWFNSIVIGQKLCPFAPPLQKDPKLMRVVSSRQDFTPRQAIELVRQEVELLVGGALEGDRQSTTAHETTLVVLDHPKWDKDFRAFVRLSWDIQQEVIAQNDLIGTLQLVLFHPSATHQTYGEQADNAGDFTIRSPYPTVHLLREVDVMRAVDGAYPNLETLPARNQAKLIEQGLEVCQRRLDECFQH